MLFQVVSQPRLDAAGRRRQAATVQIRVLARARRRHPPAVERRHELTVPADSHQVLVEAEIADGRRVRLTRGAAAAVPVGPVVRPAGHVEADAAALVSRTAVGHPGSAGRAAWRRPGAAAAAANTAAADRTRVPCPAARAAAPRHAARRGAAAAGRAASPGRSRRPRGPGRAPRSLSSRSRPVGSRLSPRFADVPAVPVMAAVPAAPVVPAVPVVRRCRRHRPCSLPQFPAPPLPPVPVPVPATSLPAQARDGARLR